MDAVTHTILILSAVCLTIGAINLRLWIGDRNRLEFIAIAFACISVSLYSWFEVAWLHAETPVEFGTLLRWAQIPNGIAMISVAVFLYLHLGAGRKWLLLLIIGLRIPIMILNFLFPVNIAFKEITAIGHNTILGENLSYPIGTVNPFLIFHYVLALLLIIFSIDAAITVWHRGDRRKAIVFGGAMALFALFTIVLSMAGIWATGKIPAFLSPSFLFLLVAMALELGYDVKRSERLADDLTRREAELTETARQLGMSADAASVGIWTKNFGDSEIWASRKWFEIFGFEPSRKLTFERYFRRVHPEDVEKVENSITRARDGGGDYSVTYRIVLPSGELRWISSLGRFEFENGKATFLRGASVDITKRIVAEQSAHELGRKLMGAQEKERARLARELHDDLSQSLALLSIQLQSLNGDTFKPGVVRKRVAELTEQIQRLSSDVHRISHELHPSKLNQLGLEAALRGFCRETGAAVGMKVRFEAKDVPRDLPNDISLCLYRIAQESLQNTVKHSGASNANVSLSVEGGEVTLAISDNGCGFDPGAVKNKESLGLVSMSERIRAANGTLTIESVADSGTKIEARVRVS